MEPRANDGFAVGVVVFQSCAANNAGETNSEQRPDALQPVVQQLQSFAGVTNIEPGGTSYLVRARFRYPEYALAARRQLLEWPGCNDFKLRVKLAPLDAGASRFATSSKQYLKIGILLGVETILQEDDNIFVDDLASLNDPAAENTGQINGIEDPLGMSTTALDGLLMSSTPLYGTTDDSSQSLNSGSTNPAMQGLNSIFSAPAAPQPESSNNSVQSAPEDGHLTQAHLAQHSAPMSFNFDANLSTIAGGKTATLYGGSAANGASKPTYGYGQDGMYPQTHQSPLLYYHQQPQHKPVPRGVISTQLYIDKLPPNITAQQLGKLIESMGLPGFCGVKLGSKNLLPGEFRTAQARFVDAPSASAGLEALHHYVIPGWNIPLSVNFLRGPKKKNGTNGHHNNMHYREPRNSNIFYDAK